MTRLLAEIDVLDTLGDPGPVEVLGIEHDSREVEPGSLFCCLPGLTVDGHDHAAEAVERGAVALLVEHPVADPLPHPTVQVRVRQGTARRAMARLAAAFWGHPATDLLMVGITGTNAKTTVAHLLGAIMAHAGRPSTVLGTLTGARTTPESTELQRSLASVRDTHPGQPRPAVAMEVSSHALAQTRVEGVMFDVAVFTNLSHDHLDFHGTMEEYFAAKASLFTPEHARLAVVNADDPWGARLVHQAAVPTIAVGAGMVADVQLEVGRSQFSWRGQRVTLPMTGLLNVHNALLAAETAVAAGVPPATVAAGLATVAPVPGRFELVRAQGGEPPPFTTLVDFAHTPAALEGVLTDARRLLGSGGGRLTVVFGCGGDRDRAKRPEMGSVARRLADVVVVTSDNPRHEDPMGIIDEILEGWPAPDETQAAGRLVVEPDRRQAIRRALVAARDGDVVVVAGKGHETVQEMADRALPFDDRHVVADLLAAVSMAPAPDEV